jgi:ParB-like chromosome segregation protein Spo0J
MSDQHQVPGCPEGSTQSAGETRAITVLLKQLLDPAKARDEWGHRFPDKYKPENNPDLLESIRLHGLLDPPVVVKRNDGNYDVIDGHRRVASLYTHAEKGAPGFSLDMPVQCLEVVNASRVGLVIRSLAGNELGRKLDVKERLLAVKHASAAGATKKELAASLGVSERAVERDVKIANNQRVLQHVLGDNLTPTAAAALVEVAATKGRLDEFLEYFDAWSQLAKELIDEEDRRAKQERGKGLKPSQMLVMSRLEPHLVRGWIEALAKGKPLTEEPDLGFEATFDKRTAVATVKLKIDARSDPVEHLVRVASQVSQVAKHLAAFARTRYELEGPQGPQTALEKDDAFLDLGLLEEFGLQDVAEQLQRELQPEDKSAAEITPAEKQPTTEGT